MTRWFDSLWARTALLMTILMLVTHTVWIVLARDRERGVLSELMAGQAISLVNFTSAALATIDLEQRRVFLEELNAREGVRVFPANPQELHAARGGGPFMRRLRRHMERELGPATRVTTRPQIMRGLWVSFTIDNRDYWLAIPKVRPDRPGRGRSFARWAALSLLPSLVGAWWLAVRVVRPWRQLTQAARNIASGPPPLPQVPETGPAELRILAQAFNRTSEEVRQLLENRTLLLAGVSHDIRTPLVRLRLSTESLDDTNSLKAGMIEAVEDIDATLSAFLDFARDESRESLEPADVNRLVRAAADRYTRAGRPLALHLGQLPRFRFRPLAIQRLLFNLIDNAFKYGGNTVEVATYMDGVNAVISVLDRGPGVADADKARLLRPFTRLSASRSGNGGSGLGLAIADRIARMHGGRVELYDRSGGGLDARVYLPVRDAAA